MEKKLIVQIVLMLVIVAVAIGAVMIVLPQISGASNVEKFGFSCLDWAKKSCSSASYNSDEFSVNALCKNAWPEITDDTQRWIKCCSVCKNGCNEIGSETKRKFCEVVK